MVTHTSKPYLQRYLWKHWPCFSADLNYSGSQWTELMGSCQKIKLNYYHLFIPSISNTILWCWDFMCLRLPVIDEFPTSVSNKGLTMKLYVYFRIHKTGFSYNTQLWGLSDYMQFLYRTYVLHTLYAQYWTLYRICLLSINFIITGDQWLF